MRILALWWALSAPAWGDSGAEDPSVAPTDQTIVYYNARMALREGAPTEAVELWLLRNAIEDRTGLVSSHDADFRSVTWAALGALGICQDGLPADGDGAGLWPVALHNWVVGNMGRRPPKGPRPFRAFAVGRQQRKIAVNDVLGADELRAVQLSRGRCLRPRLLLLGAGEDPIGKMSDPQVVATLLELLLTEARSTIAADRVRGRAAIEARLFDVHLQLAELAAREALRDAREQGRRGREVGLSRASIAAMREDAPVSTLELRTEPARILRGSADWSPAEWMTLSPERRLFVYDQARAYVGQIGEDTAPFDAIALGVVDRLIADGAGDELDAWIARVGDDPARIEAIWSGDRGARILALDREAGFGERSVVALYRGVRQLEGGELPEALRSLAYAMQHAGDSRAADEVQNLSRRWMSYAASQFASTSELLVTLQELVPSREYAVILEDLMWRAAFRADEPSFDGGLRHQLGRGALERRLALLRPLAAGDLGRFSRDIGAGLTASPSETLRFLETLVERLELEDADVRARHAPTLARVRELVRPMSAAETQGTGRQGRTAEALLARTQAILEGQGALGDGTARDRARALAPTAEVFAGSVRLAPADPLPWPFQVSAVSAPSVFTPMTLTPIEWRDPSGELVFGWEIGG